MKILIINAHLNYPGWSEGRLNLTFMDAAKAFFTERGQPKSGVPTVAETFVERGYKPEDEVQKHVVADLVILQTPVNWFGAPFVRGQFVSADPVPPGGGQSRNELSGGTAHAVPAGSNQQRRGGGGVFIGGARTGGSAACFAVRGKDSWRQIHKAAGSDSLPPAQRVWWHFLIAPMSASLPTGWMSLFGSPL
jgi:hypothetical protein